MALFVLLIALSIEHLWPPRRADPLRATIVDFADGVRRRFDTGERADPALGWAVVVIGVVALVLLAESLAESVHPLFVFALHVLVLYCAIGSQRFTQAFTALRVALAADDDVARARRLLHEWIADAHFGDSMRVRRHDGDERAAAAHEAGIADGAAARAVEPVAEISRRAVAHAVLVAHREVFAPLLAYVFVPGLLGLVVYFVADLLARRWSGAAVARWSEFAQPAFALVDWIPARLSAASFAVVGNFEDALYCWRGAGAHSPAREGSRPLLLAVAGGALGVRLVEPALERRWAAGEPGFECPGERARPASLEAAAALLWRSLVLWVGLFALVTVSAWMAG